MKTILYYGQHPREASGFGVVVRYFLYYLKKYNIKYIVNYSPGYIQEPTKYGKNVEIIGIYSPEGFSRMLQITDPDLVVCHGAYPHTSYFLQSWAKFKEGYTKQSGLPPVLLYTVTDLPPYPLSLKKDLEQIEDLTIVTPSYSSKQVVEASGLKVASVVPHGVSTFFRPMNVTAPKGFIWGNISFNNIRKCLDRFLQAYVNMGMLGRVFFVTQPYGLMKALSYKLPQVMMKQGIPKEKVIWEQTQAAGLVLRYIELPKIINQFDAMVSSSGGESFGLPALEACACGVPNIVTDLPVYREILEDAALYAKIKDYFYFSWGNLALVDIEDLAQKMKLLYEDDELKLKLAEKGLQIAKKYTWANAGKKLNKVVKGILE